MDLVIDIGNTNTKLALFEEKHRASASEVVRIITIPGKPQTSYFFDYLNDHPDINNCILSSVIHHPSSLTEMLNKRLRLIEMNPSTPVPVISKYLTPETLGYDRIAAAVGGNALFPAEDVLVMNAGTCIIYDFINKQGEYLGGSISPGMQMRFNALHTFTGKLPLITPDEKEQLTGNTTGTSILSGVMEGLVAEMEGIAGKYEKQYPGLKIILSGGDLNYLVKRLKINIFAFQNIVIHGLHQILQFNVNLSS